MKLMIKSLLAISFIFAVSQIAEAQNCPPYPNTLTNGTTADANAVMANFNAILNCLNTAGTLPTHQVFLSGSRTYTTPVNVRWIEITLIGGGGGGGSGNQSVAATDGTAPCWKTGGTACISPVYSAGGGGGGGGFGGAGGTISGSGIPDWSFTGTAGTAPPQSVVSFTSAVGANGGSSIRGGGGVGIFGGAGSNAVANSGSGGGGGAMNPSASAVSGGGGGAGGVIQVTINNPAATYTYTIGTGGAGNTSPGSGGFNGGNGAAGEIVVYEHYGP